MTAGSGRPSARSELGDVARRIGETGIALGDAEGEGTGVGPCAGAATVGAGAGPVTPTLGDVVRATPLGADGAWRGATTGGGGAALCFVVP